MKPSSGPEPIGIFLPTIEFLNLLSKPAQANVVRRLVCRSASASVQACESKARLPNSQILSSASPLSLNESGISLSRLNVSISRVSDSLFITCFSYYQDNQDLPDHKSVKSRRP